MSKFEVKYTTWISIEVEADDDEKACEEADKVLEGMTGADFREITDWESVNEIKGETE
jgi:hypothetical protein